jgi:cell shape-determining protein MreC|tara:strand:+ start:754 stop:921 length:168 start_codon:yes stop_codon:yes gene_type:complete
MTTDFENWITEELERLLQDLIFRRDRVAETFSERADLNLEIQRIKKELSTRKKHE